MHCSRKSNDRSNAVSFSSASGLAQERKKTSYITMGTYVLPNSHKCVTLNHAFENRQWVKQFLGVKFEEAKSVHDAINVKVFDEMVKISKHADHKLEHCYLEAVKSFIKFAGLHYMKDKNQNSVKVIIDHICNQYPCGEFKEEFLRDMLLVSYYLNFGNRGWLDDAIKDTEKQFGYHFSRDIAGSNFFFDRAKVRCDAICKKVREKIKIHCGISYYRKRPSGMPDSNIIVQSKSVSMGFSIKGIQQSVEGWIAFPSSMVQLVDQETLSNMAEFIFDKEEFFQQVMLIGEKVWEKKEKASSLCSCVLCKRLCSFVNVDLKERDAFNVGSSHNSCVDDRKKMPPPPPRKTTLTKMPPFLSRIHINEFTNSCSEWISSPQTNVEYL